MTPGAEIRDTVSADVAAGVRLWSGGEFFADVIVWQGYGLSNTLGMAGFPNGEAFRVGKTYPDVYLCRGFLRQTIGLRGGKEATVEAQGDSGRSRDTRRITLAAAPWTCSPYAFTLSIESRDVSTTAGGKGISAILLHRDGLLLPQWIGPTATHGTPFRGTRKLSPPFPA